MKRGSLRVHFRSRPGKLLPGLVRNIDQAVVESSGKVALIPRAGWSMYMVIGTHHKGEGKEGVLEEPVATNSGLGRHAHPGAVT